MRNIIYISRDDEDIDPCDIWDKKPKKNKDKSGICFTGKNSVDPPIVRIPHSKFKKLTGIAIGLGQCKKFKLIEINGKANK